MAKFAKQLHGIDLLGAAMARRSSESDRRPQQP
jgi:hypothetical protein